jgi:hypothetical protein
MMRHFTILIMIARLMSSQTSSLSISTSAEGKRSLNVDLVHCWPFDSNFIDKIEGVKMFGDVNSQFISDRFQKSSSALYLNFGRIELPSGFYLNNGSFTLSTWVNVSSYSMRPKFLQFDAGMSNTILTFGFRFSNYNATGPYFYENGINYISTQKLSLKKWEHLAYVYESETVSIYINGVSVFQAIINYWPSVFYDHIYLGGFNQVTFDDLRMYSRGLSATEVAQLFEQ